MADPVAIIGFAYRFPDEAVDDERFWDLIVRGRSTMREVPKSRYNINGYYKKTNPHDSQLSNRGGHFIAGDLSAFDAPFFGTSSAEAKAMDPQLRLLLETTYHALESSGITLEAASGSNTSVYVGSLSQEYSSLSIHDEEASAKYQATGLSKAMLSNRLSWFYDLRGPSMTIDTACSSSLIGIHLACQSLMLGESEMSLVGGVQLQMHPGSMTIPLARQNFLSSASHCYSFDSRASGYSRGEGLGMVVLKRLSKAIEDDDTIRAVIRGTSSNQDGRTPSITQPSSSAQESLIRQAYKNAGLGFHSTHYLEAHGTGTPAGDPVEVDGVGRVFSSHKSPQRPLYVGSVKANIGHLESAAGVAGLIKTVLALERGVVPPNAMLESLNPAIKADALHLSFPTSAMPWPSEGQRRASVNSFGVGGANAHVILDDALHYLKAQGLKGIHNTKAQSLVGVQFSERSATNRELPNSSTQNGSSTNGPASSDLKTNGLLSNGSLYNGLLSNGSISNTTVVDDTVGHSMLFNLSAADEDGVRRTAALIEEAIRRPGCDNFVYLQNLAYTLSTKRSILAWRAYAVGATSESLQASLHSPPVSPVRPSLPPIIHFVFTGQGAQWPAMGLGLMVRFDAFRKSLEWSDNYFRSLGSAWSLIKELRATESLSRINAPSLAQPICTAVQVALVDLLASFGILPEAVVGHSSGEIAAAYAAGALSKASALKVAYFRGEASEALLADSEHERGAMLAVALSEAESELHIDAIVGFGKRELLSCGCINSPKSTTVTGVETLIDELSDRLNSKGIFNRKLNVPIAYHSSQMLRVASKYRESLSCGLEAAVLSDREMVRFLSSVTGDVSNCHDLTNPDYWVNNLVSRVRFSHALEAMIFPSSKESGISQASSKRLVSIIEIGPHAALERPIKDTLILPGNYIYSSALRRNVPAVDTVQDVVGLLWTNGFPVDLNTFNAKPQSERRPRMLLDLPSYPFNRSRTYWHESRLSKNDRLREHPRHDLLGIPSSDWNPMEPKWRFTIRTSDIPWLSEHQVDHTILYPGAGFLVMMIEAARSLSKDRPFVTGYRIRDINISSALVVPDDDEGIETQLHMHLRGGSTHQEPQYWTCSIYSVSDNEWKLHCSGQIFTELSTSDDFAVNVQSGDFLEIVGRCKTSHTSDSFYNYLHKLGFHFRDNFRSMENIRVDETGREATAGVSFGSWRQRIAQEETSEHLVHPATLDCLFHAMFAAIWNPDVASTRMVPTHLSEVYASVKLLDETTSTNLNLHARIVENDHYCMVGDVSAGGNNIHNPYLLMRGCRLTKLHAVEKTGANEPSSTSLFHHVDWKPDISLLTPKQIEDYIREHTASQIDLNMDSRAEIVCRHFISKVFEKLDNISLKTSKPHFLNYMKWVRNFNYSEEESTKELIRNEWPSFEADETKEQLIDEWATSVPWGTQIVLFCKNIIPIMREEIDPLDILFNQGVAESIYRSPLLKLTACRLASYVDLVAHKNSRIRILEVGAGTGSATSSVLELLWRQGNYAGLSPRFVRYDFTDISPSFFAHAQEKFRPYLSAMSFKVLNLENDPIEQGFEPGSYDIIIAAAVIHATASIAKTLDYVKLLLKPGGHLVMSEPTNQRMALTSGIFGLLPGWWLSVEEHRSLGPLMTPTQWNKALLTAGFSGLQLSLPDSEKDHLSSVLTSRYPELPSPATWSSDLTTAVLVSSGEQKDLAKAIQADRQAKGERCEIVALEHVQTTTLAHLRCISLLDFDKTILSHLNAVQFMGIKHVISLCNQVLWVTSKCGKTPENPENGMAAGFAKSIMRENPSLTFICLNLESTKYARQFISQIVDQISTTPSTLLETDLVEWNNTFHIPRVVEAPQVNKLLHSATYGYEPELVTVDETTQEPLEMTYVRGRLDSLHFIYDKSSLTPIADDEARVEVKSTGVNFRDVMNVLGQLPLGTLSCDFSGIVTESGNSSGVKKGDRICGLSTVSGGFKSIVRAKRSHIIKIPPNMSFAEASAIPLISSTAYYSLCIVAGLRAGESVLIHSAAGGVGQAAIQIAQWLGAVVYVTVSTTAKKQLLVDRYGIHPSHCFSSRSLLFAEQLMNQTKGRGVDVILNSLSGLALVETWRCIAPLGRFVEIGKRDMIASKDLPMDPFQRNVTYSSVDLSIIGKFNDGLMGQIMQRVEELIWDKGAGPLKPPYPLTSFKRSEAEDALRLLQTGQHTGKAVISWEQPDIIKITPRSHLDYHFDSNATYVITGGLGGIGRSLAAWMARQGAKHLVLLSRSGPQATSAKRLLSDLRHKSVQVYAPPCDISLVGDVTEAIGHVQRTMPPIKGCIHGALVVKNNLFHDYTLEEFQDNLDPKIKGTWNLHEALPKDLDFFVALSSVAGVNGSLSQSSYCAASAFQDAFARFRHAQGQRCISLDLGVVQDVGYIAERVDVARYLDRLDHKIISENDLHFILKYACSPSIKPLSPWETQVICALTTPAFVQRRGLLKDHTWMRGTMFCHLYQMEQAEKALPEIAHASSVRSQLNSAQTLDGAAEIVVASLVEQLARTLAISVGDIDTNKPPFTFGVESLVAVELTSWFLNEISADIPVVQILGHLTIAELGFLAAKQSDFAPVELKENSKTILDNTI